MSAPTLRERAAGVLLHPTSLPGPHGSGDLGGARAFVDFLASASQRWWQMLPVAPPGYGESPYSAQSAFAMSPWLVSLDDLADDGLLDRTPSFSMRPFPPNRVHFGSMAAHRSAHLRAAFEVFVARGTDRAFDAFCEANAAWLDDFALFRALKDAHGGVAWTHWEAGVKAREAKALATARRDLARDVAFEKFVQYTADRQWHSLHAYATSRGVGLIGDVPIFVAHDSADVWQHPEAFFLEGDGEPTFVSGVPPDYFSRTGQRWGNPLYRWKRMQKSGFAWWIDRLRSALGRFDAVRLDHFIGFQRYWRIPGADATAENGRWMKGPGAPFFEAVREALGDLPLIAEDLGAVTPAVLALRDHFHLPGTKILQFAFGDDPSAPSFLPHSYPHRAVVYTGTHDNDTTVGWFHELGGNGARSPTQTAEERAKALRYLDSRGDEIHWDMIRAAVASVARLAVIPLQDVLGLGSEARMNAPGKATDNWSWRFEADALTPEHARRLGDLARLYGRADDAVSP